MKGISIRLFLTPDVLAKLVSAVADKFKRFVRIKDIRHAGQVYEVDLSILDAYDDGTGPLEAIYPKLVAVTREMVGELFDLLGLFPRSENPQATLAQAEPELQSINGKLTTIRNIVTLRAEEYPNSGKEILEIASLASYKMGLLLSRAGAK